MFDCPDNDGSLESGAISIPKLGLSGIWNFATSNDASSQVLSLNNNDVRARIDAGLSASNANDWIASLLATYNGIRIYDYQSYGSSIRLTIWLN